MARAFVAGFTRPRSTRSLMDLEVWADGALRGAIVRMAEWGQTACPSMTVRRKFYFCF
jgi:hypothetical protein